jgi:hypothetical protein
MFHVKRFGSCLCGVAASRLSTAGGPGFKRSGRWSLGGGDLAPGRGLTLQLSMQNRARWTLMAATKGARHSSTPVAPALLLPGQCPPNVPRQGRRRRYQPRTLTWC